MDIQNITKKIIDQIQTGRDKPTTEWQMGFFMARHLNKDEIDYLETCGEATVNQVISDAMVATGHYVIDSEGFLSRKKPA